MRAQSSGWSHYDARRNWRSACSPGFSRFSRDGRLKPGLHTGQNESCCADRSGWAAIYDNVLTKTTYAGCFFDRWVLAAFCTHGKHYLDPLQMHGRWKANDSSKPEFSSSGGGNPF